MIVALCPQEVSKGGSESPDARLYRKAFEKFKAEIDLLVSGSRCGNVRVFRLPVPKDSTGVVGKGARGREGDPLMLEQWDKLIEALGDLVSSGISSRLAEEVRRKEKLQSTGTLAKYTAVFSAAEHISASLYRCGLVVEALSVYDSLDIKLQDDSTNGKRYRTLFFSSGLPQLGGSQPILLLNKDDVIGKLLLPDTITYVEFRQYLIKRQCQLLFALRKTDRLISRLLSFLKSFALEFVDLSRNASKDPEAYSRMFLLQLEYSIIPYIQALNNVEIKSVAPSEDVLLACSQLYSLALENFWWLINWRIKDKV
ncbi:hypothetical protein GNI_089700 [Gregarina niphandrodes]|uniref:TRAPPC10/Trs130 N-terminal domain-containing protein n=1 Tax=Gregarina niphandrodes TaxID=110365 RepID=A0A023B5J2_GRENI|nr:hypothetical protein GNI_089700 [Gregarina niphandrodes]EZG61009.1 hypothetical protein GNI_089700 [Gregarina niphandrodes]|eukprot:XP_011130811.1 hypothetical protein GNI_089700 [Gregarina niphandrodes]